MAKLKEENINYLVVHCSATSTGANIGAKIIRKWHTDRGWDDIGYHYVIRRNGDIELGRQPNIQGAHARGINSESLGICMIGGVDERGMPDDNFTTSQFDTLAELLKVLKKIYNNARIIGHREVSNKACPSFNVHMFLMEKGIKNIHNPNHYKVEKI